MKVLGIVFLSSLSLLCKGMERTPPPAPTNNQIILAEAASAKVIGLPSAMRESPPSSSSSSCVAQIEPVENNKDKGPVKRGSRIVIDQRDGTNIVLELSLPDTDNEHVQHIRIALENNDRGVKKALRQQMAEDALRIVCGEDNEHYKKCEHVLPKIRKRLKDSLKKNTEQQATSQQSPQPLTRTPSKESATPSNDLVQQVKRLKDVSIVQLSARRAEEVAKKTPPQTPDIEAQTSATRKPTPSPRELYLKSSTPKKGDSQNNVTNTAVDDGSYNQLQKLVQEELAAHGASRTTQRNVAGAIAVLSVLGNVAVSVYSALPKGTPIPGTNFTFPPA